MRSSIQLLGLFVSLPVLILVGLSLFGQLDGGDVIRADQEIQTLDRGLKVLMSGEFFKEPKIPEYLKDEFQRD